MNYDDDDLIQLGADTFAVINYDNDTMYLMGHCDTVIENKHIVTDTFIKRDTVYIETQTYDKEIEIIEKLIQRPDFGKNATCILVLVFVCYTIWKKWSCKKNNNGKEV